MTGEAMPRARLESRRASVAGGHQLHLVRITVPGVSPQAQCLLLPGLGRDSGSWLAGEMPWPETLARAGFEVYLADTRGKGRSAPRTGPQSTWACDSLLEEELPALLKVMRAENADLPWCAIAANVDGLALLALLATSPASQDGLAGLVLVQVARPVLPTDGARFFWDWWAGRLGRWASRLAGYARAPWCGFGDVPESRARFLGALDWFTAPGWYARPDGQDLSAVVAKLALPPVLHLLPDPDDRVPATAVRRFVRALPRHDARILLCPPSDFSAWQSGSTVGNALGQQVIGWLCECCPLQDSRG